jgi:hypothetical protein
MAKKSKVEHTGYDPEKMFGAAECYRRAALALNPLVTQAHQLHLLWSMFMLYALAIEIFLKCILVMNNKPYQGIHTLKDLFHEIPDYAKANIENRHRKWLPKYQLVVSCMHGVMGLPGTPPTATLALILERSSAFFVASRYPYEGRSRPGEGFMAGDLCDCIHDYLLEIEPAWKDKKFGIVNAPPDKPTTSQVQ